jgi:hypothetical protein
MATVIPDKLYAAIKHRKEGNEFPTRLGFISPYEKNAAFRKRKDTQDQWAYGRGTDFIIKEDEGVIHGTNGTKDVAEYFMTNSFPRIVKNEPATGFEIARSVRRSGWKGAGNVLWRIQDPRGFEVEIISENFASIIDCTTVINGVIQEACVWGREGSVNVLLPTNSEPYKDATRQTNLVNNKVSLRDVKIGDHVTLIDKGSKSGHRDGVYMGRMFAVTYAGISIPEVSSSYTTPKVNLTSKVIDLHVFYDPTDNRPYGVKKPVVGAIVATAVNTSTHEENIQAINDQFSQGKGVTGFPSETVLAIAKAADLEDITVELEDAVIEMNLNDRFKEINGDNFYHSAELILLTKDNTVWYASTNARDKNDRTYNYGDKIPALVRLDLDKLLTDKQFHLEHTVRVTPQSGGWYGRSTITEVVLTPIITQFNPDEYKAKTVWLKHGDYRARLVSMPSGPQRLADSY